MGNNILGRPDTALYEENQDVPNGPGTESENPVLDIAEGAEAKPESKVITEKYKRGKRRIGKEMEDYGGYQVFQGNRYFDLRGQRVQVPEYRLVFSQNLADELVNRNLLSRNNLRNPQAIEKVLQPILESIIRNNRSLQPKDIQIQGEGDSLVLTAGIDNDKMSIPFSHIKAHLEAVLGPDGANAEVAFNSRTDARYNAELKGLWSKSQIEQLNADFYNVSARSLQIFLELLEQKRDFAEEYLKAKSVLAKQGSENIEEVSDDTRDNQEIVRAFEEIALKASGPNYRDFILQNALLTKVKEQERKSQKEILITKISDNPENYTVTRIIAEAHRMPDAERSGFLREFLNAAGVLVDYQEFKRRHLVGRGQSLERDWFRVQEPKNFPQIALAEALELLKRRAKDANYELPPAYFKEQAGEFFSYNGAVKSLPEQQQPALVVQEETGAGFLRLYIRHPQKPEYYRRYLPLGQEKGQLQQPSTPQEAGKFWQQGQRLFAAGKKGTNTERRGFNAAVSLVEADPADPKFEFALGLTKEQKRLSEILENFDFGRRLTARVCLEEFLKWKQKEKQEGQKALTNRDAWNRELTQNQRNQITKMTTILSQGGVPSLLEQLIGRHINENTTKQASLRASKKYRLQLPTVQETPQLVENPVTRVEQKSAGLEIQPDAADYELVRELVYAEVPEGSDFMPNERLLQLVSEKAQQLNIKPAALTLRLLEALDHLSAGQKRILSSAVGNLELARQLQNTKLTPEESLAVLVRGLRTALAETSLSQESLPSDEALVFVQEMENQGLSTPALRPYCVRQFDTFMAWLDPDTADEVKTKKFINFWNSLGKGMAESASVSRQIEGVTQENNQIT